MSFIRFSVIFVVVSIFALCPSCSTFYSTSVRLCGFVSAFYRRCSLPTFRAYRRTMATVLKFSIVPFPPRSMRLVTIWMLSVLFASFVARNCFYFLLVLDCPCPLAYFPFVLGPYLLLVVMFPTTNVAALYPNPLSITAFQLFPPPMVPYCRPLASH